MTRYEKHAWFNLTVLALSLTAFGVLLPIFGLRIASGAFGLLGFWGLGPILFFVKQRTGETLTDERDEAIRKTASQQAFALFWLYFVGSCITIWALNLKTATVSVDVLPLLVVFGWMVFVLVHAVSTLIQYRRLSPHAA
jgi:uncharacterized membrane protein